MAASLLGELSCAVCLGTYTDPVTLPCMHSYCRQCLWDLTKSKSKGDPFHGKSRREISNARKQNQRVIDCPECRYIAVLDERGINGLPKNFTLAKLVERCKSDEKKQQEKEKVPCSVCDVDPPRNAVKSCNQCCLSYCVECIPHLHPKRGALARHDLVAISLTECHNEFCPTCNKIIDIKTPWSHGHQTVDLKEARLQKLTSLEKSLVQLEKNRREVGRSIFDNETFIEQIQVAEKRKMVEITQSMERIREMLNNKESQLKRQIQRNGMESTQAAEQDTDNTRHIMAELSGIFQSGQTLLNAKLDASSFIEKAVALEKKITEVESQIKNKKCPILERTSDSILEQVNDFESKIQNILEKTEVQANLIKKEELTPRPIKEKVELMSVETVSSKLEEAGCLHIKWRFKLGRQFDLKLSCSNSEGNLETTVISNISSNYFTVDRLWCDKEYQVSVSFHGQPETVSEIMTCKTDKTDKKVILDGNYSFLAERITNFSSKTKITPNVKKVRLQSVKPNWDRSDGVLWIRWQRYDQNSLYDIKVVCCAKNCKTKSIMLKNVNDTFVSLGYLYVNTNHDVSVMVHGRPETESEITSVKTLPYINVTPFVMDSSLSSNDVDISSDSTVMMHVDNSDLNRTEYTNIAGTTSSHILDANSEQYWEVKSTFFMGRLGTDGDTAFEIGICDDSRADNITDVKKNYSGYICCAVRRGNSAFLEYYREGKNTNCSTQLKWKKPFIVHLGFFFNPQKRTFSIINIETGQRLVVFGQIKQNYNYVAMFDTGNSEGRTKLKMELLTGCKIDEVPDIVYKELL